MSDRTDFAQAILDATKQMKKHQAMTDRHARRVQDACATLGIGKSTLYKLASEGKVRLIRIAGRTLVPESEIDRLAAGAVPHSVPHLVADRDGDGRTITDAQERKR